MVSDKKSIQLTHIFIECLYSIHFNKTINVPQSFILLSPFPFRPPLFQKTHHLCLIPLQIFLENCFCTSTSVVSPDSSSVSLNSAKCSLRTASVSAVAFATAVKSNIFVFYQNHHHLFVNNTRLMRKVRGNGNLPLVRFNTAYRVTQAYTLPQ